MDFLEEKLRRAAFHEAGHAWMMLREGLGISHTTIGPSSGASGDNRGETLQVIGMEEGRSDLAGKFARAALAGSVAEHYLLGSWDEDSLQAKAHDSGRARSYLAMAGEDLKPDALDYYVESLANSILDTISAPPTWNEITALAYALMEKGTLSGEEAASLLDQA